jgi:hypothetical protein
MKVPPSQTLSTGHTADYMVIDSGIVVQALGARRSGIRTCGPGHRTYLDLLSSRRVSGDDAFGNAATDGWPVECSDVSGEGEA